MSVATDLNVTGKPAQFGRGVMAEVAGKLVGQFADCLASQLGGGDADADVSDEAASLAAASVADEPGPERSPSASAAQPRPTADAIDLLDTAGAPVLKRVLPVVAGLVALLLVWRLVRRSR